MHDNRRKQIAISHRMLSIQGFNCQIRIFIKFNVVSKMFYKHKKVFLKWIINDIIVIISTILRNSAQQKYTNRVLQNRGNSDQIFEIYFPIIHLGCTIEIKVNILFVSQKSFAYIYWFYLLVRQAIKKYWKMLKNRKMTTHLKICIIDLT